jgi:hypothetical protein
MVTVTGSGWKRRRWLVDRSPGRLVVADDINFELRRNSKKSRCMKRAVILVAPVSDLICFPPSGGRVRFRRDDEARAC